MHIKALFVGALLAEGHIFEPENLKKYMDSHTENPQNRKDPAKPKIPIVAMTANAFAEDKEKALAVGMNAHIAKPIDMNTLIPLLLKYL